MLLNLTWPYHSSLILIYSTYPIMLTLPTYPIYNWTCHSQKIKPTQLCLLKLMLFDLTQLFFTFRCFVVILVLLSMAWIPIINSFSNSQLFVYIQSISSFLTPPVAATFLMAIFWHRTTEPVRFRDFLSLSLSFCLSVFLCLFTLSQSPVFSLHLWLPLFSWPFSGTGLQNQ